MESLENPYYCQTVLFNGHIPGPPEVLVCDWQNPQDIHRMLTAITQPGLRI